MPPQPTAFIFHGTGSNPEQHWFRWLKSELEERGYEVFVPEFPTMEGQSLDSWLEVFEDSMESKDSTRSSGTGDSSASYEDGVGEDTIFVGHSTGAVFIVDLLDIKDFEIEAAFLVSGFVGPLGLDKFDPLNETFAEREFDWENIRESCGEFVMFHADNDPYVPLEKAQNLSQRLDAELEVIEGGKHLNQDAGYTEFPELLRVIETKVF